MNRATEERFAVISDLVEVPTPIIQNQINHLNSKKKSLVRDASLLKDLNTRPAQQIYTDLKKTLEELEFWIKRAR